MDRIKVRKAIRLVAKRNGIPEKQVVEEMEAAISLAYNKAREAQDSRAISLWKQIPKAGDLPTAYELVAFLSEQVNGC